MTVLRLTSVTHRIHRDLLCLSCCCTIIRAHVLLITSQLFRTGEEMSLNIFEPRYRLLIRRCLEGSRKFGMATINRSHELNTIACEVEIQECQAAPDGRFLIDIVGSRRFRVARSWEQVLQPSCLGSSTQKHFS